MGFDEILKVVQIIVQIVTVILIPLLNREIKRLEAADRDNKERLDKLEQDNKERLDKLEQNCKDNCSNLAKGYVSKDEYLKTNGEIFRKLDDIIKNLYELKGEFKKGGYKV